MAVFNPTRNQVLFKPDIALYAGDKGRQDLTDAKQESGLRERRADLQERQVENQEEQFKFLRDKHIAKVGEEKAERDAFNIWRATEEINALFSSGGKTEEAETAGLELAAQRFGEIAEAMPEGEDKQKLMEMLEGGVTTEEYQTILAMSNNNAAWYKFGAEEALKPTGKMIEGASMDLQPGTPEWAEWIRGTNKGGKPLAAEVKAQMVFDAMHGTFKGEKINDEMRDAILDSLGVQRGPKGSVTIKWDDGADMAEAIIDRTSIYESGLLNINDEEFESRLTWSLIRLAKDGRYGGKELEERALADALGADWQDILDALEEKNADLEGAEQWEIIDILKVLAEK